MKNVQKINGEIMSQNTYQILLKIESAGILKDCVNKGIIPINLFIGFGIYKSILTGKESGRKMSDIVMEISIKENIHTRSVYKINKRMEY